LVRLNDELTLMETAAVAVAPRLSFTCTVNANVPFAVGVPEITPELAEIPRPGGSDPADPGPGAAASPDTESAEVHGPRHVPSAGE